MSKKKQQKKIMYDPTGVGEGNGKVYVGIPRERFYMPEFVDNRDAILTQIAETGRAAGYFQAQGHRVDRNRDQICKMFLEAPDEPEWLLMLDSDMEHPVIIAERLVRWKKPVVGGLYFHRGQKHSPFAFKYAGIRKGDDGRPGPHWASLGKTVYEFLEANGVPMQDGALTIDNVVGEALVEVDAVATGAMLIHRSVLEFMPYPWWEYRAGGQSEDLIFCKEARERGIPIYCDFSTVSGHYNLVAMGQAQFRMNYVNSGINNSVYSKGMAMRWWSKWTGCTIEEAKAAIEAGNGHESGDYWRECFGDRQPTPEEERAWYTSPETAKHYAMELLHWNFTPAYSALRKGLVSIRNANCLDFGAGIGTLALQMWIQDNHVMAVETNERLREFIDIRFQEMKKELVDEDGSLGIVGPDWIPEIPAGTLDCITCMDVLEHLPEDDLVYYLGEFYRILKKNGRVFMTNNWEQQDIYPQHHSHQELLSATAEQLGFRMVSDMELWKL